MDSRVSVCVWRLSETHRDLLVLISFVRFVDRGSDIDWGALHPGERIVPCLSKLIVSEIDITPVVLAGWSTIMRPSILAFLFPSSFRDRFLIPP